MEKEEEEENEQEKEKKKKNPTDDLKMVLESSYWKQIVGNSLLFHFVIATFSLLSTVFELWRHKGG